MTTPGETLRVKICDVGTTQPGSSSVPAAKITSCGALNGSCHIRTPHVTQRTMSTSLPESARLRYRATGPSNENASRGPNTINKFVAPVSFLQSMQ